MDRKYIKSIGFLIFTIISVSSMITHAQVSSIDDVRNKIFYSEFDLKKSIELFSEVKSLDIRKPIVRAYEGASGMLVAKYSWNPITKISHLKEGIDKLNEAVISDQSNIEIRFLRFYIENSLPQYLGMKKNMNRDKKVIIEHIDTINTIGVSRDIALYINQYMIDSGLCTTEELELISKSISEIKFRE